MFPGFRRGTNDNFVQSEWRMGVQSVLQLLDNETLDRCRERHDLTGVKLQVYMIVASILNHFFAIHSSHTTNSFTNACMFLHFPFSGHGHSITAFRPTSER